MLKETTGFKEAHLSHLLLQDTLGKFITMVSRFAIFLIFPSLSHLCCAPLQEHTDLNSCTCFLYPCVLPFNWCWIFPCHGTWQSIIRREKLYVHYSLFIYWRNLCNKLWDQCTLQGIVTEGSWLLWLESPEVFLLPKFRNLAPERISLPAEGASTLNGFSFLQEIRGNVPFSCENTKRSLHLSRFTLW